MNACAHKRQQADSAPRWGGDTAQQNGPAKINLPHSRDTREIVRVLDNHGYTRLSYRAAKRLYTPRRE